MFENSFNKNSVKMPLNKGKNEFIMFSTVPTTTTKNKYLIYYYLLIFFT